MITETLHAYSVLFFRQEKSFHNLAPTASDNSKTVITA
jgi:hypothetical protein